MPTARRSRGLYLSLVTAITIGVLYWAIARAGIPASSSPLGHWSGVVGFILMLGAETLYSWRKQTRGPARGRMSAWMESHVFMGLIGPVLVLLHTAWRLGGLAGWVMALTVLMVVSGFLCRYVYTALPRTIDGAELTDQDLAGQLAAVNAQLQGWEHTHSAAALGNRLAMLAQEAPDDDAIAVMARSIMHWRYQQRVRRELRTLPLEEQAQLGELAQLLERRYRLAAQTRSLAVARRLLSLSRAIHIVIGVVLFLLAFVHAGAALYYVTLAR